MRNATLLLALFCAACSSSLPSFTPYVMEIQQGNVVTPKMMMQLRPGMSKAQVRFVMGTPLLADSFHANRWDYFYELRKQGKIVEQRNVVLEFENEKLKSVRGDVIPSAAEIGKTPPAGAAPQGAPAIAPLPLPSFEKQTAPAPQAAPAAEPAPQSAPAEAPKAEPKAAPVATPAPESVKPVPVRVPAPKAEPAPQAAPTPKAAPAAAPVVAPAAAPAAVPAPKAAPKPAAQPAPKPVAKPEPKPVPTPEDDLPPEEDPSYFERMLEKIGF
ncbi:MAG TPA: outer membrane protein assembly factor BamE [Methylophilaceae bacterium]|nr:outer membrane protein assembly factor BamE [Methylophilaceae bacterium]